MQWRRLGGGREHTRSQESSAMQRELTCSCAALLREVVQRSREVCVLRAPDREHEVLWWRSKAADRTVVDVRSIDLRHHQGIDRPACLTTRLVANQLQRI